MGMEMDSALNAAKCRGWDDYHAGLPSEANPWAETAPTLAEAWDQGWDYGFTGTAICAWAELFGRLHRRRPTALEADAMFQCGLDEAAHLLKEGFGSWDHERDRRISFIEWISFQPRPPSVGQIALAFCLPPHDVVSIAQGPLLTRQHLDRPLVDQVVDVILFPEEE